MNAITEDAALRRSVLVDATPEQAFRVFTEDAIGWWPVSSHAMFRADAASIVFEPRVGGRVYERAADGREADWGRIVAWEPPARLVMRWEITDAPTEVEVRFTPEPPGTRVELEHRGWGEGDAARDSYGRGWELMLGRFAERLRTA